MIYFNTKLHAVDEKLPYVAQLHNYTIAQNTSRWWSANRIWRPPPWVLCALPAALLPTEQTTQGIIGQNIDIQGHWPKYSYSRLSAKILIFKVIRQNIDISPATAHTIQGQCLRHFQLWLRSHAPNHLTVVGANWDPWEIKLQGQ